MKKLFATCLLLSSIGVSAAEIIDAPVDHIYIPEGFDSNDSVEFFVTGNFPSPCFSRNKVDVEVVGDSIKVHVSAISKTDKSIECVDLAVPFKEVVSVGNLQGGDYKIVINEKSPTELKDKMFVKEATSSDVDDSIYAMVDYIDQGFVASGNARLVGWKPSSCLELDHVKYISNGKDTLSVLPVMKKTSSFCPMKLTPMIIPISYDRNAFKVDKILLYTRTLDGKSVNSLVNLR
jgi:hypothetical protein